MQRLSQACLNEKNDPEISNRRVLQRNGWVKSFGVGKKTYEKGMQSVLETMNFFGFYF
jgi:hypothetical protein